MPLLFCVEDLVGAPGGACWCGCWVMLLLLLGILLLWWLDNDVVEVLLRCVYGVLVIVASIHADVHAVPAVLIVMDSDPCCATFGFGVQHNVWGGPVVVVMVVVVAIVVAIVVVLSFVFHAVPTVSHRGTHTPHTRTACPSAAAAATPPPPHCLPQYAQAPAIPPAGHRVSVAPQQHHCRGGPVHLVIQGFALLLHHSPAHRHPVVCLFL